MFRATDFCRVCDDKMQASILRDFKSHKIGDFTMDFGAMKNDLYNYGVFDAWQYVVNTNKQIAIAEFCRDMIKDLISNFGQRHDTWRTNLFNQLYNQKEERKMLSISVDELPDTKIAICDKEIEISFLLDKLTKDFFQYIRNSFDSMSQVANSALLASEAKMVDTVHFQKMQEVFNKATYATAFPSVTNWYNTIETDGLYKYINDFCNRIKHVHDVYFEFSASLFDSKVESVITAFSKKSNPHARMDLISNVDALLDFTEQSYQTFLSILMNEVVKKTFVGFRLQQLNIYQQKFKDDPSNNFAIAFFESSLDIADMPEAIEVLLIQKLSDGNIESRNCKIDSIYVKKPNVGNEYFCKYTANEPMVEDSLMYFRKYTLYKPTSTDLPLIFQAMQLWTKEPVFYHRNPYMSIKTVSDDEYFLKRVQLPI